MQKACWNESTNPWYVTGLAIIHSRRFLSEAWPTPHPWAREHCQPVMPISNPFSHPVCHWKEPHQALGCSWWWKTLDQTQVKMLAWASVLLMDRSSLFSHLIPFQITIYDQENFRAENLVTSSCPNVSERNFDNVRSLKVECVAREYQPQPQNLQAYFTVQLEYIAIKMSQRRKMFPRL